MVSENGQIVLLSNDVEELHKPMKVAPTPVGLPNPLTLAGAQAAIFGIPPGKSLRDLHVSAQVWLLTRLMLLPTLIALPFVVYHDDMKVVVESWYASILGIIACMIPSAGAPVAGGIIFLPVLNLQHICAADAVAFSAATQTLGVGIFAPMGWLVKDRSVFLLNVILVAMPSGVAGLLMSLLVFPAQDGMLIEIVFIVFCAFVLVYTLHGLMFSRIQMQNDADNTVTLRCADVVGISIASFVGAWMTGYIGIGVEKFLFILLTWRFSVNVRAACITSITVVGWLSGIAFLIHALAPRDAEDPGYIGAVPYAQWLMVAPGVLFGSMVGPWLNSAIGSKNIMWMFCVLLAADIGRSMIQFAGYTSGTCVHLPA